MEGAREALRRRPPLFEGLRGPDLLRALLPRVPGVCSLCGCTDAAACGEFGCAWDSESLCTACAPWADRAEFLLDRVSLALDHHLDGGAHALDHASDDCPLCQAETEDGDLALGGPPPDPPFEISAPEVESVSEGSAEHMAAGSGEARELGREVVRWTRVAGPNVEHLARVARVESFADGRAEIELAAHPAAGGGWETVPMHEAARRLAAAARLMWPERPIALTISGDERLAAPAYLVAVLPPSTPAWSSAVVGPRVGGGAIMAAEGGSGDLDGASRARSAGAHAAPVYVGDDR